MASKKPLNNGRNSKQSGAFSAVPIEMQDSPAFKSLTASSILLLLRFRFKYYMAATRSARSQGPPTFKFTNTEARKTLGMNAQTFSRAKQELADKGFSKWVTRGGLKGVNGVASEFTLSNDWKTWEPPPKARRKPPAKPTTPYGKNL